MLFACGLGNLDGGHGGFGDDGECVHACLVTSIVIVSRLSLAEYLRSSSRLIVEVVLRITLVREVGK